MTRPGIRYRPATLYGRSPAAAPGRAAHLVDAENLLGTAAPCPADVLQLNLAFTTIGFSWRGPQYLLRSGPDGADLALLAVLRHDHIAARFRRVVIASGDHIFTSAVTDLATVGCQVTVASRRGRLARTLEFAADGRVIYLDPPNRLPGPERGIASGSGPPAGRSQWPAVPWPVPSRRAAARRHPGSAGLDARQGRVPEGTGAPRRCSRIAQGSRHLTASRFHQTCLHGSLTPYHTPRSPWLRLLRQY